MRIKALTIILAVHCAAGIFWCAQIPEHSFQASPIAGPALGGAQSSLTITLANADLTKIQTAVGDVAPKMVEGRRTPASQENPWFHFDRQSISVVLKGGRLALDATYRGVLEAKGGFGGLADCRLDPVILLLSVTARPVLRSERDAWFLGVADAKVDLRRGPGTDTQCTIIPGLINVGGRVDEELRKRTDQFKSIVENVKFPLPVGDIKAQLHGPIILPLDTTNRICLYPLVGDLELGRMEGIPLRSLNRPFTNAIYSADEPESLSSVDVPFIVSATPILVATATSCAADAPLGLRMMELLPEITAPGDPAFDDSLFPQSGLFRMLADVEVGYSPAKKRLRAVLAGLRGQWGPSAFSPDIGGVDVENSNGQVTIKLALTGALTGSIFFWGTPTASADGKRITTPNLQLAAPSRGALQAIDPALPALISGLFSGPMRDALVFDLGQELAPYAKFQSKNIALAGGRLSIGAMRIRIAGVEAGPGALSAYALLEGTVSATLFTRVR